MKKGFTLIELVITAAIAGIMAAAALPVYESYRLGAQEAAAKDNLRILRNVIEIYTIQHNGIPPGYVEGEPSNEVSKESFADQLTYSEVSEGEIRRTGLVVLPENPFNGSNDVLLIANGVEFPERPVEPYFFGWVYKPETKNIRLNWDGEDKDGIQYFDY
ncbi:MAG: type II secretion system protein [Planctomycetota bacterium]|jgi:prepilin-type N-terminal cleavage/methylation domain-containing protein